MAKDRQGHTVANIKTVLDVVDPPDDAVVPVGMTGFDVFAGYLLLDALVANQDRHEENWAVLRPLPGGGPMRLSGSYDHGSSLGFNLQDERRLLIMKQGVRTWANKGRAQRFERVSDGRLSLVQLAGKALSLTAVTTRQHWIGRLDSVPPASWSEILDRV